MICSKCESENTDEAILCTNCSHSFQSIQPEISPLQHNENLQHQPYSQHNQAMLGKRATAVSLVCGVIALLASFKTVDTNHLFEIDSINAILYTVGVFALPTALSIIAIVMGHKAKRLDGKDTPGFALGIIAATITGLRMVYFIMLVVIWVFLRDIIMY